ncbi:SBBP repeat-containing protein [Aetokthonos hydrillicola Thurmond2011]|jgi:hypothetical protein|uniref:SBBP repeat-containing protein n=1 Tax=Aetokthonos hydrillicola Thurmond2011 TaxID=2712845 RepID=A0AAP5IGF1_9CYAN|nr:SBBP repeat-containing protein [Aetokthonos hydrillicola]MBO3457139.1 hypothetical protein [Aetokthonos hydrillicola CCALA 1050]MBW4587485.1 SBBP repeat-containing protein [Aetokthonos hydrillicola CCALA 1050]MDR9898650.1 SBBP repeat-containing protein [Aetokthonos hydrillicola Thurmond2011]
MKSQWKWHRLFLSSLIATTITTSLFDTNSYRATANSHQTLSNTQRLSQFQTIGLKKSGGLSTLVKPNLNRANSRKTISLGERSPIVTDWIRQFGTLGDDSSGRISIDKAGNVYVVGSTSGSLGGANAGNYDAFVTKYDNRGNRLWIRQWGTSGYDGASDVAVDNAGNVYVAGSTGGSVVTSRSISGATSINIISNTVAFVTKYDTNGNQLWTKQFGTATTLGIRLALDSSDNVYITGNSNNSLGGVFAGGIEDAFVAKYSSSGTQLWIRQLGTSSDDNSFAIGVDSTGNVYIAGYTDGLLGSTRAGGRDAYIAKYNTSGTQLWIQQLGTSADDLIYGLALDSNGNIYITGNTTGSLGGTNAGGSDVFIAKYNSSGTRLWTKQLGTNTDDYSGGIAVDSTGNAYITGFTKGSLGETNLGSYDAWIGKYDSNGQLLWKEQLGTVADDEAFGIAVQGNSIYLTGETAGALAAPNAGSYDAWLAKFSL